MAGTLFLRLSTDPPQWRLGTAPDAPTTDGPLAAAADAASGRRVVVLVPATDCTLMGAELPTRNRERLARAIPFALEEQLADDVEDLHFALGGRDPQGLVRVAVVARRRLDHWVETLRDAGITPHALVPEVLALPREPDTWTLLREADSVQLRRGDQDGVAFDPDNLRSLLPLALDETRSPPARIVAFDRDPEAQPLPPLETEIETGPREPDALALLTRGYQPAQAINLLQGEYSRSDRSRRLWRPWRAVGILTLIWLALQWGWTLLDQRRLADEELALRTRIAQVYRDAFPEASRIVDPRLQMQRGLDALRAGGGEGGGGVLDLLARGSEALVKTPNMRIASLRYKDQTLTVNLDLDNIQVLDGLKQQLETHGLAVEIRSARSREGKVEGVIAIRRAGT